MGIKQRANPFFRVVDIIDLASNVTGNGWKLYTYIPGTTDNKATYQDKDGSVAHANPIILTNGQAEIWWDGEYDLKLVDENDVQQWTFSNYGAGEDTVNYGNYNKIKDGGFEDDSNGDNLPDQWGVTEYPTAGSGAGVATIDTSDQIEGAQALKFTSVGDGGGYAESQFFEVIEGSILYLTWMMKSSAADVRNVVEIIWYTSAQVQISTTSLYDDSATNPTSWTEKTANATVPSTARFAKVRVTGCHSSDATTGSTWFDAVACVDAIQTIIQLLGYSPVNKAGDTMTAALVMNTGAGVNLSFNEDGVDKNDAGTVLFDFTNSGAGVIVVRINGNTVLTTADEGSGNGLDADTVDGIEGSAFALDTDVDDLSGVTDAATARTNLGLAGRIIAAWCSFDGTGTVGSTNDDYNVSSITDNGTGNYTVSYTSSVSANNAPVVSAKRNSANNDFNAILDLNASPGTASCRVQTGVSSTFSYEDSDYITVIVCAN